MYADEDIFYIKEESFQEFSHAALLVLLKKWKTIWVRMNSNDAICLKITTGSFYHIGELDFIELLYLERFKQYGPDGKPMPVYYTDVNSEFFHPRHLSVSVDAFIERVVSNDPRSVTQLGYELEQVRQMNLSS